MNKTMLQGKWRRMRGSLKTEWGRLTDNDRRQLDGKLDQMVGLFQERYGYTQERATKAVTHYLGGRSKRSRRSTTGLTKAWLLGLWVVGLFGLGTAVWFFQGRFWPESQEPGAEVAVVSPEAQFE